MSVLLLRGLSRARGLAGEASQPAAAAAAARLFASGAAAGAKDSEEVSILDEPVYDAARASQVPRVQELIGDARTGVADDTTRPLHGDLSIEWIWHQNTNEVDWFRYSIAGPDVLPHMHMDSRLSDHSKNLMYLLRCKDPERWTIEALATKFRIRRQRVLAILAHKEVEAQGMDRGELMKGPYRPFAFTVDLDDLRLDGATGDPLDLGDVVHAAPGATAAAQQVAAQQQQRQQQQQQQQQKQAGKKGGSAADDPLGSLADFLEPGDGGRGAKGTGNAAGAPADALAQLQLAARGGEHDLGLVMPRLAAAAQRVHLHLAQLLRRCSYSPEELRRQLLARLDAAEAAWGDHAAGGPLEAALVAAARRLEAAAGAPAAPAAQQAAAPAEDGGAGAQEGGDGAEAGSAPAALPRCLDFAWQRRQVDAVVAALAPLMDRAGLDAEREAARLGAQLRRELAKVQQAAAAPATQQQEGEDKPQQEPQQPQQQQQDGGEGGSAPTEPQDPLSRLRALVTSAPAAALGAAFNRLDLPSRRALVEAVPEARAALSIRGVDLRAALEEEAPYSPTSAAVSAIGAAATGSLQQLPSWPGAVPSLVDAFCFRDVPRPLVDAALGALRPLEDAAHTLDTLLAAAAGEDAPAGGAEAGSAEVELLREAAATYSTLAWAYDQVLLEQEAEQAGGRPPVPPRNAQRRMMRILRELDPNALEKLLYWESWQREAQESPERAAKLRRKIQRVINRMNARLAEGGEGEGDEAPSPSGPDPPEYPDLPELRPPTADAAQRVSLDALTAFIDAEVVGRQFHRGSGDRHFVRLDSAPKFEGYSLEEFDKVREGELSAVSRKVAEVQDDLMWREFREKVYHNLGLVGTGLWVTHGHARPQRPAEGWSWVVHDTSKHWRSKKERARRGAEGAPAPPSTPGQGGPLPYVAQPDGTLRPLSEEEAYLHRRQTPKPRARWYFVNRRPGRG